jgi:hypothetical protein
MCRSSRLPYSAIRDAVKILTRLAFVLAEQMGRPEAIPAVAASGREGYHSGR